MNPDIEYYRLSDGRSFSWSRMCHDYASQIGVPHSVQLAAQQFCEAVERVRPITSRQLAALTLVSAFAHAIAMSEVADGSQITN